VGPFFVRLLSVLVSGLFLVFCASCRYFKGIGQDGENVESEVQIKAEHFKKGAGDLFNSAAHKALSSTDTLELRAVGYAEGSVKANGEWADAYYEHFDSGLLNFGMFSCTVCRSCESKASKLERAQCSDKLYLSRHLILPQIGSHGRPMKILLGLNPGMSFTVQESAELYEIAMKRHKLRKDHPMLVGSFLLLVTQSPGATFLEKGFLDTRVKRLKNGYNCISLAEALVDAFRSPSSGALSNEAETRRIQRQRLAKYEWFIEKHRLNSAFKNLNSVNNPWPSEDNARCPDSWM
jgi:hypothetical protein